MFVLQEHAHRYMSECLPARHRKTKIIEINLQKNTNKTTSASTQESLTWSIVLLKLSTRAAASSPNSSENSWGEPGSLRDAAPSFGEKLLGLSALCTRGFAGFKAPATEMQQSPRGACEHRELQHTVKLGPAQGLRPQHPEGATAPRKAPQMCCSPSPVRVTTNLAAGCWRSPRCLYSRCSTRTEETPALRCPTWGSACYSPRSPPRYSLSSARCAPLRSWSCRENIATLRHCQHRTTNFLALLSLLGLQSNLLL